MTVNHTPPLVLVADDQIPTTQMLKRVFEYEGYQVNAVHDGVSALDAARTLIPDLILLDINMPGMNGFEVLQHLRETSTTANIPTIMITAMGELSDVVQGLNLGADDYVRKPFHPRELLARAQSKMKARKLEDTLHRRTQELEALLRVSEELNKHLEIEDLIELILSLTLELLPGQAAVIYQVDENGQLTHTQTKTETPEVQINQVDHAALVANLIRENRTFLWADEPVAPNLPNGMVSSLYRSENGSMQMLLTLLGDEVYDDNHLRLLDGISKQANLALRNAELYEIKSNYAEHLEEMVDARTQELRSAQHMLIRSEKLASVGRLAASIAHEINNPLLPIQINLDDMLEDLRDGRAIGAEEIVRTQESVERIRRVVNRLLEFTGRSHATSRETLPIDVNKIIQNVTELVRKSFEQERKKITLDLSPAPPIPADKDGLEQVFMNLVLNASEAMNTGGHVHIHSEVRDGHLVVKVSDNGSGIPADIVDNIFEPFISTKDDGNGLGLFVSYGIIQNHNGSIEVESKVNVGTTFTIKLPFSAEKT